MSLGTFLRTLPVIRRTELAATRRAALDLDVGAMLVPSSYPYPPGRRPIAPFAARIIDPRGPRPNLHLFPPVGNPTQRLYAHIDYAGRAADNRSAARDASGARRDAKGHRVRPWLFTGWSSATEAERTASGLAAGTPGPCVGCD